MTDKEISLKEEIAEKIALHKGLCEWTCWETLPQVYKDECFYPLADQILSLLKSRIEKARLTEKDNKSYDCSVCDNEECSGCGGYAFMSGSEAQYQAILKELE